MTESETHDTPPGDPGAATPHPDGAARKIADGLRRWADILEQPDGMTRLGDALGGRVGEVMAMIQRGPWRLEHLTVSFADGGFTVNWSMRLKDRPRPTTVAMNPTVFVSPTATVIGGMPGPNVAAPPPPSSDSETEASPT